MQLDPPSLSLKPGEQGAIAIKVDEVVDLYGLELHLRFDPNLLEVIDGDEQTAGIQIAPGGLFQQGFVAVNQVDNSSGKIDFAATLLNPALPINGGGVVGIITFKARQIGESALKFETAILATREAVEIQAERQDGTITVSAEGQVPMPITTGSTAGQAASEKSGQPGASQPYNTFLIVLAVLGGLVFVIAAILLIIVLSRHRQKPA